jgi:hypothetical protein
VNDTARQALERAMAGKLDPTNEESVSAALRRVLSETALPFNTGAGGITRETAIWTQLVSVATRLVIAEGLLGAMGRATDELGARIDRLEACAKSALRRGDLEPLAKAMGGQAVKRAKRTDGRRNNGSKARTRRMGPWFDGYEET